jgi:hypothetical protein
MPKKGSPAQNLNNISILDLKSKGNESSLPGENESVITYKDCAEHLFNNGYQPVPIEPGTKAPLYKGWSKELGIEPVRRHITTKPDHGIGVNNVNGMDIDAYDAEIAAAMELKISQLHPGYLKRVGQDPKFLVPMHPASELTSKRKTLWTDQQGQEHAVELLHKHQQQFVVYATHPGTNEPYKWYNNDLWHVPCDQLDIWTQGELDEVMNYFDSLCEAKGFTRSVETTTASTAGWSQEELAILAARPSWLPNVPVTSDILAPLETVPVALLKLYLAALPQKYCDNRDSWFKIGGIIYDSTGGSDEGYQIFDTWSKKSPKYNQTVNDTTYMKWGGYRTKPGNAGVGTIIHWLAQDNIPIPQLQGVQPPVAPPVDPVVAAQALDEIKLWVQITPNPQYGWIKKAIDLPAGDIDIIVNDVHAKTGITKTILKNDMKRAKRKIARRAAAAAKITAFTPLNARWGWTTIGKNSYVVDTMRKDKLKIITSKTFAEKYGNQYIETINNAGDVVLRPLGDAWLKDDNRRDFEGIYFHPTKVKEDWHNLYNGFAVTPAAVMDFRYIQLYANHIHNIICSNDADMIHYVWAWCADLFQHPEEKKGVAVVMMGGRGVGKGFFAQPLSRLWGSHFMHLTNAAQLTGKFNSHLANKILVFVDEAFWSEDKRSEGVLKGLITEAQIPIEAKGIDVVNVDNFCKFIMASNEEWTVPAGTDERRFCCIDVSNAKAKDHTYFSALAKEVRHPLFAPTLLRYLLDYQYDCDLVRRAPASSALTNQKLHSLDAAEEFWFEALQVGSDYHLYKEWDDSNIELPTSAIYIEYIGWCNEKHRTVKPRNSLCKKLFGRGGLCPDAVQVRRVSSNGQRGYQIPKLEKCRKSFEKYTSCNTTIEW